MLMAEWVVLNKGKLNIGELATSDYVETRMTFFFGEFEAPNFNNLYGDILKKLWDDYIYKNLERLQNFYNEVYVERVTSALNYKNVENENMTQHNESTNNFTSNTATTGSQVNGEAISSKTSTQEATGNTTMGEVTKKQTTVDSDVAYNSMVQKERHKSEFNSVEPATTNTNSNTIGITENSKVNEITNSISNNITGTQNGQNNNDFNGTRNKSNSGFNGKTMAEMLIESNKQFLLNPIDDFIDAFCKYNLYYLF